jgi:hypothetical protein
VPDTVKLPIAGPVKKKTAAAVLISLAGIAAILWYRRSRSSGSPGSATAAAGATVTDPAGNVCSAVNPATGYCPGTAEDLSAQQQGGLASADTSSEGMYYDPATGLYDLTSPYSGQGGGSTGYTSNAQWSAAAEQGMGSDGADAIAAALGKYLLGLPLTSDQVTIIEQAIATAGQPPIPGPGGYPPSYKTAHGGGGGGGGGTKPKPKKPARAPSGTHTSNITWNSAMLGWQKVTDATSYRVYFSEEAKGTRPVEHSATVKGTSYHLTGLKDRSTHHWQVAAVNKAGEGPRSALVTFTTAWAVPQRK